MSAYNQSSMLSAKEERHPGRILNDSKANFDMHALECQLAMDCSDPSMQPFVPPDNGSPCNPIKHSGSTLSDFGILLHILASCPSHCQELIVHEPGYIGFCDTSSLSAGSIRFTGSAPCPPLSGKCNGPMTSTNPLYPSTIHPACFPALALN